MDSIQWKEVKRLVWDFLVKSEFEGLYLGAIDSEYGGKDYLFNNDGVEYLIWGKAAIQSKMALVKPGSLCKIVYTGDMVSPKSKRKYQNFQVFVSVA